MQGWNSSSSRGTSEIARVIPPLQAIRETFSGELRCEMIDKGLPTAKVEDDPPWHLVTHRHIRI